jgi:hypothetical protein
VCSHDMGIESLNKKSNHRPGSMRFQPLATKTDAIPMVARWLYEEWGHRREGNSYEGTCQRLSAAAAKDGLPMYLLAIEGEAIVGCAERGWFHGTEVTIMERDLRRPADPIASPNGWPAERLGNSEASGGPPSVD